MLKKYLFSLSLFVLTSLSSLAQVAAKAENVCPILIGSLIPEARVSDINGKLTDIRELVRKQPTVLVFYRGGWCPYCNKQLSGLGKMESEILKLGYQIVAISPDDAMQAKSTQEKNTLGYRIYADPGGDLIKKMGIAFTTPEGITDYLKKQNRTASDVMPVPAVFVLNTEGRILFEYINPNYKERLSENVLLSVLQSMSFK